MSKEKEEIKKLNEKIANFNELFRKYSEQVAPIPEIKEKAEMIDLLNTAEQSRKVVKETGRTLCALQFNDPKEIEKTKKMLDFVIENKKWKDPYLEVNLLLEWALYRAFWAIGGKIPYGCGPVLNWDGSEPIHTSSGLQPDLLVDFGDFILVIESTICSGPRQYDTETEPVIRHIARIIQENKQKNNLKPVYAFFVAREIDPNVIEYFYVYYAFHKHPLAEEYITVTPLTVSQFKEMFQKLIETKSPKDHILRIFEKAREIKSSEKCSSCGVPQMNVHDWYKKALKIISEELLSDNLI